MLAFLVENPPVGIVVKVWQTASKRDMPPKRSRTISARVSRT